MFADIERGKQIFAVAFADAGFGFFEPGAEIQALEFHRQLAPFWALAVQAVQAFRQFAVQIDIGFDGNQFIRERQARQRGLQVFSHFAFDFIGMRHHALQRIVAFQPFHRRFGAAFFHAGHVVDFIAHQRQIIDDLVGAHAEFVFHAFNIERFIFHGVNEGDAFAHQLRHVFIAGGNHHIPARFFAGFGQRADHIIGLYIGHHQHRPAHQPHQFRQHLGLRAQIIRHGRARGFVVGKHIVAEIFAFGIKHAAAMVVRKIGAQAAQHIEHAVKRARGRAVGRGERRHGVISAVEIR